jgi:hypothetical protein
MGQNLINSEVNVKEFIDRVAVPQSLVHKPGFWQKPGLFSTDN